MCGQDPTTATPPPTPAPTPAVAPRKFRSLAELRCDHWKRKYNNKPIEDASAARILEENKFEQYSAARLLGGNSKPKLKKLEDLVNGFQEALEAEHHTSATSPERHSREALLAARPVDLAEDIPDGLMTTAVPKALAQVSQAGSEDTMKANERLMPMALKPCFVKDCASTVSGSRAHSEGRSSESSRSAAAGPWPPTATTLSADAAPFCLKAPAHLLEQKQER